MTYDEFLAALRKTRRDWKTCAGLLYRTSGSFSECPITAVAPSRSYLYHEVRGAAKELGLPDLLVTEIVNAADSFGNYNHEIRKDLLEACGLKGA